MREENLGNLLKTDILDISEEKRRKKNERDKNKRLQRGLGPRGAD